MKYMNAGAMQRFLAYLVDFTLISIFVNFIVNFIPTYTQNVNFASEYYAALLKGDVIGTDVQELTTFFKSLLISLAIMLAIEIPFHILYLVVLPYFWEKQTLGRWLMHVKVVTKTEEKVKISNLLLRELVGGFVILRLFSASFILPVIYLYLCLTTGRTLSDMIGGTRLIDTRFINAEFLHEENEPEEEKDYVDATFRDVTDESKDNPTEDDTDYKVF